MFVLVLRLVVIITVAVVVVVVAAAAAAATQLIFAFLCTPKNRQIGAFTLFDILDTKNTVNTDVFCAPESQHHDMYDVVLPLVAKITAFTVFLCPCLAKTLAFPVFTMLQDVVAMCEKDNHIVFYDLLASRTQQKSSKNCSKTVSNRLPKAAYNFSISFPTPPYGDASPDLRAYARQPARDPLEGKGAAIKHKKRIEGKGSQLPV